MNRSKSELIIKKLSIMKKVKIMLTTITVFAVVGGALAFMATKFNSVLYCTTEASNGNCTILKDGFTITPAFPGQQPVGYSRCTDVKNGTNCIETPIYVQD